MIAHVAAVGEARGRVVLQLCSGRLHRIALEAAIRVAQAFQSEIESVFVEDRQLIELARFPFAREISLNGRQSRAITCADVERDLRFVSAEAQRLLAAMARHAEVPLRQRVVRDEPVRALAAACAESGPWNVIALTEPIGTGTAHVLRLMLDTVAETTGVIVVGRRARRTTGPVVIAVEDMEHLPGLLRAAERLAPAIGGDIVLLLIGENEEWLLWLDGQARLALADMREVRIVHAEVAHGEEAVAAEALRRCASGFAIGQFGGLLVPDEGGLRPLAAALECPLLLVR
ncbi:MAG: hypothetical protein ACREC6_12120 [Hyphomicrobiaceae bacterium]